MERAPGAAQGHSASIHPHLLRACRFLSIFFSGPNQVYTPAADRATQLPGNTTCMKEHALFHVFGRVWVSFYFSMLEEGRNKKRRGERSAPE